MTTVPTTPTVADVATSHKRVKKTKWDSWTAPDIREAPKAFAISYATSNTIQTLPSRKTSGLCATFLDDAGEFECCCCDATNATIALSCSDQQQEWALCADCAEQFTSAHRWVTM